MHEDLYQMYLEEIELIEPCTIQENAALLSAYQMGDSSAKTRLAEGNLKAALFYVEEYKERGTSLNDLVQEANVALLLALDTYHGGGFEAYLEAEVKAALDEAIGAEESAAKAEEEILARVNVLKLVTEKMAEELGREATIPELAKRMKMTEDEIRDIIELTLAAMTVTGEE